MHFITRSGKEDLTRSRFVSDTVPKITVCLKTRRAITRDQELYSRLRGYLTKGRLLVRHVYYSFSSMACYDDGVLLVDIYVICTQAVGGTSCR